MTDGRTDGGDCNIPNAFLKKCGDKYRNDYLPDLKMQFDIYSTLFMNAYKFETFLHCLVRRVAFYKRILFKVMSLR